MNAVLRTFKFQREKKLHICSNNAEDILKHCLKYRNVFSRPSNETI